MSTSTKSSPIKSNVPKSPPQEVLFSKITEATPITTVLPEGSTKKKKNSSKKEKSQVSKSTSPLATVKELKHRSKKTKSKSRSKTTHTMHELYVESLDDSNVDPVVVTSVNTTVNLSDEIVKGSETLSLENPKPAENLGEIDLGCSDVNKEVDGAPTKATNESVMESSKESIPRTDAASDAMPSAREEGLENTVIPDSPKIVTVTEKEKATETPMTGDVYDDNTVVLSHSDESLKTVSEDIEFDGAEKNKVVTTRF
uniref:Uncharacterized protein n=1 Tax=Trifolium medium TaxID=97028 RepID=A0A392NZF0_9FABA